MVEIKASTGEGGRPGKIESTGRKGTIVVVWRFRLRWKTIVGVTRDADK